MSNLIDDAIKDFYLEGMNKRIGWSKFDPVFEAAKKELNITSIFVCVVYKEDYIVNVSHSCPYDVIKGLINKRGHAKDLIINVEKECSNSVDNICYRNPYLTQVAKMYCGKDVGYMHYGIFRPSGEFDGILLFVDSNNPSREWNDKDKDVIFKLGSLISYDVLNEKFKYSSSRILRENTNDFIKKIDILSSATNEYLSIYLIDYEYGYMSLYPYNKTSIFGKVSDYSSTINKFFKEKKVCSPVRDAMVLKLDAVKNKLKDNKDYFAYIRTVENGNVVVYVFKFSLIVQNKIKNIVLAIRKENEEITSELNKMNELEETIRYTRAHDPITGLYNRTEFMKKASSKLKEDNHYFMIVFDVDRFSVYNSYYGVQKGDELLIYIGKILMSLDKEQGGEYAITYCKLSNDNYLVLLTGDESELSNFVSILKTKILDYDTRFIINISVGAYDVIDRETPIMYMIDNAMAAKKTVKARLDKKYAIFEEKMNSFKENEQDVINNMDKGIEDKEFAIYLQPKIDITNDEVIGAEALVRWVKDGKVIPPNKFIPVFEKNGFIIRMDKYVWEETLKYLKWRKDNNLRLFPISVNVSRAFLLYPSFVNDIVDLTKKYGVEPNLLELELTETIFVDDVLIIKRIFEELRGLGFKVLMDDFGSGYSSLNVLKDVEFDKLKIDMKFFSSDDDRSLKIIETVINLAKKLEIPAIAEGVETKNYVDLLYDYGCRFVQGYYYSKPLSIEDFNKYVDDHSSKNIS